MICDHLHGNLDDADFSAAEKVREHDAVRMTWQECARRFQRKTTDAGRTVGLLLPVGVLLRHGDVLHLDDRLLIHVHVLPARVLEVPLRTLEEAAVIGYELGTLHCSVQFTPNSVLVAADEGVAAVLARLGFPGQWVERRFEPRAAPEALRVSVSPDFQAGRPAQ